MSALLSTPKPPSIGLPTSEPTVSTAFSRSVVSGASGWNSQPVALRRVEQHAAERAGQRHGAEPPTGRRAGVDEQFGDLDRVVEGVGADHAHLARDRVERLDAAGERAGMRHARRRARLPTGRA